MDPSWFSRRYPSIADLESAAWHLRAKVVREPGLPSPAIVLVASPGWSLIALPAGLSPLEEAWQLAHELGHLRLHRGYISPWMHDRQEAQANRWAARALIPEASIRRHANASLDAFIAALSVHYEELPPHDCAVRRLAGEIATIRLKAVEEVA